MFGSSKKGAFWQAAGGQLAKCWGPAKGLGLFFRLFDQKPSFGVFFIGIDGCLQLSFFFSSFWFEQKKM